MKEIYEAINYLKGEYEAESNVPIEAVQNEIDQRGRRLFKHQDGDSQVDAQATIVKVRNIASKLKERGYPVTMNVFEGERATSVSLNLVNPNNDHHFVPLFGFHLWKDTAISMRTLHERAVGAESVLDEAFK